MSKNFKLEERIIEEELKDDEGMLCQMKDGVLNIAKTNFIHTDDVIQKIKDFKDELKEESLCTALIREKINKLSLKHFGRRFEWQKNK